MSSKKKEKVFVFGIDGATFSLVRKWVEEGYLPTIESIIKDGTAAVCNSTIPPVSCPAWKSFSTGVNPGKLGIFDLIGREPDTYTIQPSRADMVTVPDLWDILSAEGYRVGVFNVPATYPAREVNGFLIAGMLGDYDAPDFMYPPQMKPEIDSLFEPPYRIEPDSTKVSGPDEWLEEQYAITKMKVDITKHLLVHKEWDFFITVLYEVDRVQHIFWHHMDKNHPRYEPSYLENTILNSYRRMDRILGEMIDLLPEDVTIVVMSDHGFGPIRGYFRLNQWLLSRKYLKLDEESMKAFLESVAQRFLKKESSKPAEEELPSTTIGGLYQIDWPSTKAYAIRIGNLYLNVRGREPLGIIEVGTEYEELRNQLIQDLSTLTHPKTKKPLEVTIHRKEDIYSGEYFRDAPDLLVSIEDYSYLIEEGFGPMWGGLEDEGGYTTGGHKMDGIFIASGHDIKVNTWIDPINIVDIAPTILHIMDVDVPRNMDGTVLHHLFREESSPALRNVEFSSAATCLYRERHPKTHESLPETDEKVLKRLRDLGYLE